jgi:hypothetical protein
MIFASTTFAAFLVVVFVCYWSISRSALRARNGFLLIASYVFYGWWDWRILGTDAPVDRSAPALSASRLPPAGSALVR